MTTFPRLILCCFGVFLGCPTVQARHKHHSKPAPAPLATPANEPAALPSEAAPAVNANDPPSVSLQWFVDTHLGTILAPLGTSAFEQTEVVASLKANYNDAMMAAPAAHQPAFRSAIIVCDALASAIAERQNAVSALRGALATRSSEAEQPRGGGEAVTKARDKDAFFVDGQKSNWTQRAAVLRQNITALYLRERATERQIGVWTPPPAPAAPAVAAATPSVSAPPAASSQETDPVLGSWLLEGRSSLTLAPDHSISGDRHGSWRYTCTTNSGRNYEMHWQRPKDWVDYVVLSDDAKTLDGKSRKDQPISYHRQ